MTVSLPETTKTFGQQAAVVLTTAPASKTAVTAAELTAGENITMHLLGQWFPTAATDKVTRQRKMGQTKTTPSLGTTTWDAPALQYTINPQTVGTPGSAGNEAYEALPEDVTRYLVLFTGVPGDAAPAATDAYQIIGFETGPQVRGQSADDAGAEAIVTQEIAFLEEYSDGPVDGVVAA